MDLRKNFSTKLYIYSSHLEILKGIEQKRNKNYTINVQNKIDPEKRYHSSVLHVILNIKSYITNKIANKITLFCVLGSTFSLFRF